MSYFLAGHVRIFWVANSYSPVMSGELADKFAKASGHVRSHHQTCPVV